jgi:hypothetical protein
LEKREKSVVRSEVERGQSKIVICEML